MSRSNYNTVEDRDYESRRERERERSRNADRYDGETRHHGKWTASGEATDLETGSSSYHKERRAGGLGNRSYSDREVLDSDRLDRNRSSSNLGYNSGFGSNYDSSYGSSSNYGSSSIPVPPPMPPADFYAPHGSYRSSSGYGNHYGSGLGALGGLGGHSGYGNHYGSGYDHSYGSSGYGSHYGSGLGHSAYGHPSYGSSGYGSHYGSGLGALGGLGHSSGYGSSYGHPSYGTGFGHPTQLASLPHTYGPGYQATQIYGSDYYFGQPGYGPSSSSSLGSRSRGLGGLGRKKYGPKTDIYELGNDYIIEMDLPGHQRDHIDIKLAGNELYVISKPPARTHNFHINERSLGRSHVERKFYLPADVTSTSIAPVLTNGVLRLVLPRSALANTTTTPLVTPTSVLSTGVKPHTTTVTDTVTTSTSTNQVVV